MRAAAKVILTALFVQLCAAGAGAQAPAQTPEPAAAVWATFAPADEPFTALLPGEPSPLPQLLELGDVTLSGRLYSLAGSDQNTYQIWSLANPRPVSWKDPDAFSRFLDDCAELAWALLVEPAAKRASWRDRRGREYTMNLGEERYGPYTQREYGLRLGRRRGAVAIVSDGRHVLIASAHGLYFTTPGFYRDDPSVRRFLDSFAFKVPDGRGGTKSYTRDTLPELAGVGDGSAPYPLGPGRGGNADGKGTPSPAPVETDYTRPFKGSEVTRRAAIRRKPEPAFTESARKFNVTGVVRLRVLLGADGSVANISIVKRLPHGLTEKAVEAARGIVFTPAEKDGRIVSQYIVIEYNFNIY